jgi:hypothetical protein
MSNPKGNIKHGMLGTSTYRSWKAMRQRTGLKRSDFHKRHYANIECCQRWASFELFLADMGQCPAELTLDRIDNSKGYEPGNCRWASVAEQNANRSSVVILTHNGFSKTVAEWGRCLGINANVIRQRLYLGWDAERALTIPVKKRSAS